MNQNVWGPHLWFALHTVTFNYPIKPSAEDKESIRQFFYHLQYVLPCRYCRENYRRNLKETPIRLDSRRDIVEWLIDLHNEVNGQTGKKTLTYDQVIDIYQRAYNKKLPLAEQTSPSYVGGALDGAITTGTAPKTGSTYGTTGHVSLLLLYIGFIAALYGICWILC